MRGFLHTHFDKCTGCSICQLACSFALFKGYNPRISRLLIQHKNENLYHIPVVCNQCENAYCMNACPTKAIERDENDCVVIDQDKCVACGLCGQYCPLGVINFDPETDKAFKCELCDGHPVCVEACPTGALEFIVSAKTIKEDTDE
ncbi:MAG: 4Fe-4S dicluster domain-containing protein [Desulfobacteraceae bacterium]|nr:4Fe-4S dicluster domain-containing protein [Desulfobacteraceae bacterium]